MISKIHLSLRREPTYPPSQSNRTSGMRSGVSVVTSSMAASLCARVHVRRALRGFERRASCRAASSSGRQDISKSVGDVLDTNPSPPLRCYYSDWAVVTLPDKHRFPMDKYRATRLVLENDQSLAGRVEFLRSPTANLEDVLAVHDSDYVQRVMTCTLSDKEARAIGFPMQNPEQVTRSFASTGGTIQAMHDVLKEVCRGDGADDDLSAFDSTKPKIKVAAQIAGGTHHAFHDSGEVSLPTTCCPWHL